MRELRLHVITRCWDRKVFLTALLSVLITKLGIKKQGENAQHTI